VHYRSLAPKGDNTKTFQVSKKWLLTIVSLVFLGLAIWAVADEDPPLPIVENAHDLCYEQPTEQGLLCLLGICVLHKETIPIRNRSVYNLTNVQTVLGSTSIINIDLLNYDCGIDDTSGFSHACDYKDLLDPLLELDWLVALSLFQGGIWYDLPDYGMNDIHSIYAKSLITVDLFGGQNLYGMYVKNGVQYRGKIDSCSIPVPSIFGNFNVERNTADYANRDYRLYTQVAGKPFNLQAVFYANDLVTKTAFDGDVQVELVDAGVVSETSYSPANCRNFKSADVNQTVYLNNHSSQAFTVANDKAIKNAAMRLWAFKYSDNSIVDYHCTPAACYKSIYVRFYKKYGDTTCANFCQTSNSERECYGCLVDHYAQAYCSRDNFAIRPDGLRLRIGDNSQGANGATKWITSNQNNPTTKTLTSGYNYPIEINATRYNSNALAEGYTNVNANETIIPNSDLSLIKATGNLLALAFNGNTVTCNDTTHRQSRTSVLLTGTNSARDMLRRDNVGTYDLWMADNTWTRVDWDTAIKPQFPGFAGLIDCITDSGNSEGDKVGCTTSSDKGTATFSNIPIHFVPYGINVSNLAIGNLPRNGAANWLYMSDLRQTPAMAVDLNGTISAANYNSSTTTNFVNGCEAQNVNLQLDFNSSAPDVMVAENLSDHTQENIQLGYRLELNNDGSYTYGDVNKTSFIFVPKTKFLKDNNGTTALQILYNIPKIWDKVLNPVRILYNKLKATLINDGGLTISASANMIDNFYIEGINTYDRAYTFFYSRVFSPYSKDMPTVLTLNTQTTMSVLAYCDQNCTQYSSILDTSIAPDTNWYKVKEHLPYSMGLIQNLRANKAATSIVPKTDIVFANIGTTDPVTIGYPMDGRTQVVRITIEPDLWLKYHSDPAQNGNPYFDIKFASPSYEWFGVGKTGNVIETKPIPNPNRLSW